MNTEVANLCRLFFEAGLAIGFSFILGFVIAWYLRGKVGKGE